MELVFVRCHYDKIFQTGIVAAAVYLCATYYRVIQVRRGNWRRIPWPLQEKVIFVRSWVREGETSSRTQWLPF